MSTTASIRNLQIITALDSLSYGLIYGFISPYILKLGASHVHVGLLAVGNLLAELLSPEVLKLFTHLHGRKYTLLFILNTAMVSHLLMVLTDSYWFTILIRILFSLTDQSQNLCLELLLNKAQNEETRQNVRTNHSVLCGSGYILGPIISGYLFDKGFGYIAVLAAFLALINTVLLMEVVKDDRDINPDHTENSVLTKASDKVSENIKDFKSSSPEINWDLLLTKYLFSASVMIFFSKFTQILKHNFHCGNVAIGYTASYINTLVFVAARLLPKIQEATKAYPVVFLNEIGFFLMTIAMTLANYSPFFELYLLVLIPVIFLRTFIMSMWKDLFLERKNDSLCKLNNAASVVAGLTVPVLFGVVCNRVSHQAVIMFSCIPELACWLIVRLYSRKLNIEVNEEHENGKKKDS